MRPADKSMALGTAMWGWTIPRQTAFALLDTFYQAGHRQVDTATNYPIDKDSAHWRLAEQWLADWIRAHGVNDLKLSIKVGSVNNLGGPEHNLRPSCLLMHLEEYQTRFGEQLHTLYIHWDKREDVKAIAASVDVLRKATRMGLSGIDHPALYVAAGVPKDIGIQVKHNLLHSSLSHYLPHFPEAHYVAYGINAGGLRADGVYTADSSLVVRGKVPQNEEQIRHLRAILETTWENLPPVDNFYQLGLLHALYTPQIGTVIIGPSKVEQLEDTLAARLKLVGHAYGMMYARLIGGRSGHSCTG